MPPTPIWALTPLSREVSPLEPVVVTVAQFNAGTAFNIIPGEARLAGTVRCLSNAVRDSMSQVLERITAGICAASRCEYDFSYIPGPPVVVNDRTLTAFVEDTGRQLLGADNVLLLDTPTMGAEDFAYYLERAPGAFLRLGVGADVSPLHTPTYNFSDAALPFGIELLAHLALGCGARNF
jgi:amidohydrolase